MMMRRNNFSTERLSASLVGVMSLFTVLATAPAFLFGQGGIEPSIRQSTLPSVPYRVSRPLQGIGEDETWTQPTNEAPTASFLESVKTNDAAIEIILGQGRLLAIRQDWIGDSGGTAFIGIGDPSVIDFEILPDPHFIRIMGLRPGVTDLSIMTPSGEVYCYEVAVGYDLELIRAQLQQLFPDAFIQLGQLRGHIIVEGQARSPLQVSQIIQTLSAFLSAAQVTGSSTAGQQAEPMGQEGDSSSGRGGEENSEEGPRTEAGAGGAGRTSSSVTMPEAQIINLLRVPGSQQVLLKVKIAELNRTALREIGADMHIAGSGGEILGTSISTASVDALTSLGLGGLTGTGGAAIAPSSTAFGIFPGLDFDIIVRALRQNAMLQILAEPNLITLSGTRASILAGGEYPVPVPSSGTGGGVTVKDKEYGVRLEFLPLILSEEKIRLSVNPEVSNIDFSTAATLVDGGSPVPGLTKRSVNTHVELGQGQTLAIGGLLSVEVSGETSRIPGLGDLPYLGTLFGSTTHRRVEKELLVLVTPYIVDAMDANQVGPLPGSEITDPNDDEFYSLSRIEGRMRRPHRSTVDYEYLGKMPRPNYEMEYMSGPIGFSTNR
jgi:pilus assembly protein CpaC